MFVLYNLSGGGAERVAVNYLRQLDTSKYASTLIVLEFLGDLLHLVPASTNVIELKMKKKYRLLIPLLIILKNNKPDVVFTTHSFIPFLLFCIKPYMKKYFHIARMPNMPTLEKKYLSYGKIIHLMYFIGYRSADIVVAQTEDMKKDAMKIYSLPETKTVVLHNPIDVYYINSMLTNKISPFGEGKKNIVASGRLAYQKAFDVLIHSIKDVSCVYPNLVLSIFGRDHGEGKKLKELVKELGINDHVQFCGFVENPYLYYQFSDLFVLSSRYEGFPNVILENYYLNTPIVSTNCIPMIEKLINQGENGYICNVDDPKSMADAILKALNLSRKKIKNPPYFGGCLASLINNIPK